MTSDLDAPRFTPAVGLDEQVALRIGVPVVNGLAEGIRHEVELHGPIEEGILRAEVYRTPGVALGTRSRAVVISTRPRVDGNGNVVDVAAFVEFGTRFMTPRRYMARASNLICQRAGYGTFRRSPDPWPHR